MYANGCYCEADRREDDIWVVEIGKTGFFPDPGIRILLLDPMKGEGRGFPFFCFAKCDTGYLCACR